MLKLQATIILLTFQCYRGAQGIISRVDQWITAITLDSCHHRNQCWFMEYFYVCVT